jgi:hypothetical protein
MTRLARPFSWHLFALALVVAGLGVLAPLAWWPRAERSRSLTSGDPPKPQALSKIPHEFSIDSAAVHQAADACLDPSIGGDAAEAGLQKTATPPIAYSPQEVGLADQADRSHRPSATADAAEGWVLAPIQPPIADEIRLDPSIRETPSLPWLAPTATGEEKPEGKQVGEPTAIDDETSPRIGSARSRLELRPSIPEPAALPPQRPSLAAPLEEPSASTDPLEEASQWPVPHALIEQVRELAAANPSAARWSEQVLLGLKRLRATGTLNDLRVGQELLSLRQLADEARVLAAAGDDAARSRWLRAGYALVRRLVLWDQVHQLAAKGQIASAPVVDRQEWLATLAEVRLLLGQTATADAWRRYLLLAAAEQQFDTPGVPVTAQRQLARDMLHRLHSTQLSRTQEQFLRLPPFQRLGELLLARASQAPDLALLLATIEHYEAEGERSATGRAVAREYDLLRWSVDPAVRELAETVNAYYRNANVRVALSQELVNRLLPQQDTRTEPVHDSILGAWVSGHAQTNTRLRLVLLPDEHRWNMGLEAVGEVASNTASSKGPATFYQQGWSMFRARKRLTVDRRGIRLFNAEAEASSNSQLHDFETDFDGIPLLSGLIRAIARNHYESSQPAAKIEVEGRIIVRAASELDEQVTRRLEQARQDLQTRILRPLQELNLEPTAVDLATTAERLIARYRIAARDELSAHTPRPQAPGDSMLSVQIHQSAFNNVLEKLHLQGRRVELTALYREMAQRFSPQTELRIPEDLPENVYVTFADEDPVRIDCQQGRVRLTIRLAELTQEGTRNRWSNFTVRAYYAPSADQLEANLVRDGIIELIGDGRPLPIGQRVALSGIFNKVLSRNRKLSIINQQIAQSPHLSDQQVTQFVIHDGWIAVALGPKAPGRQAAMYPRPPIRQHE